MPGAAVIALVAAFAQPVPVRLTITVEPGHNAAARTARLVCGTTTMRASGYLRDVGASRACRMARRHRRVAILTHQPDPSRQCAQIFSGPEKAHVTGRIGWTRVDRRLTRLDDCETSDWDAVVPLVPEHMPPGLDGSPSG